MNGLVSILIPCYNGEIFLKRCFECLLNQSYKKIEVIFVNDGSTDKSEEIAKRYSKKLIKEGYIFKYIYKSNGGAASAINQALKEVTGDYIMLYDVDDIIFEDAVLKKVEFLENNKDYDMVRNNGYYVNNNDINKINGLFIEESEEKFNEYIFNDLLYGKTNNWPGSFMVKSEVLFSHIKNREIYISQFGQNLQIMLPVAYYGKCGFIDVPLMKYVKHVGSHSSCEDYNKKIRLMNGYEENRIQIIKSLNIDKEQLDEYIKNINNIYCKIRMEIAINIKDKEMLKREFNKISKVGKISKNEKIMYYTGMYNICNNIYKIYRCVNRVFRKIKRELGLC